MSIEVIVPNLPESVQNATLLDWRKQPGEAVAKGETLVELETDKVVLDVPAPQDGVVGQILRQKGDLVTGGDLLAFIGAVTDTPPVPKSGSASAGSTEPMTEERSNFPTPSKGNGTAPAAQVEASAPSGLISQEQTDTRSISKPVPSAIAEAASDHIHLYTQHVSPAVRRLLNEHNLEASQIAGTGKDGRVTKQDILEYLETQKSQQSTKPEPQSGSSNVKPAVRERGERRVPMTRLRARIAERLLESQRSTATLTTFNEVNMQKVFELRNLYKTRFEQEYKIKLGFMSFFVKATVEALKRFPIVNAGIEGDEIVYHDYYDIGIAVSTERGLVVPVLREADKLDFGAIEKSVLEFSLKAREGKLTFEELSGGTFTITNGGIFGSMLSTPILNPPQSGILGLHAIKDRPVVEDGQIVIRPIVYVAFSYDHRLIDGREAVSFLYTIKELLEDPVRMVLNV